MRFPSRLCLAAALAAGLSRACFAALTPEYITKPELDPAQRPHVEESQLNRLVRELKRSSRSFAYLRTVGFDLSDRQFEELIAANDVILRPTRIVRRDEKGNRIVPGWPGVALNLRTAETGPRKNSP